VGRSAVEGLRVRSQPALAGKIITSLASNEEVLILGRGAKPDTIDGRTAHWLRVIEISGSDGWVFGGYLDIDDSKTGDYSQQKGDDPQVTVKDFSRQFGDGKMVLMSVTAKSYRERYLFPMVEAMFVRTAKGGAQVAFTEPTGIDSYNGEDSALESVEVADVLGDGRKEISCTVVSHVVDGGENDLRVYGTTARSDRYTLLDKIYLDGGDVGEGCGSNGSRVMRGPESITEGGKRIMRLVRERTRRSWNAHRDDGSGGCQETITILEETYELVGAALIMTKSEELESRTTPR
jgi:hypothetical protein